MSKIHILNSDGNGKYNAILHVATPVGTNSIGFPWVKIASSFGTSTLSVGTNPGQITQIEYDSISAGSTIELRTTMLVESGGAGTASIDEMASKAISTELDNLGKRYKYYGYTQN